MNHCPPKASAVAPDGERPAGHIIGLDHVHRVDTRKLRAAPASGQHALDRVRRPAEQGFDIAPVHLDLKGKDRELVGLGSYLVNAVGGCNDCHTNPPYAAGGDPFMGQPKKVNVDCYLAGGMQFGPFTSRNLTPENGLPEGHTYQEFLTFCGLARTSTWRIRSLDHYFK